MRRNIKHRHFGLKIITLSLLLIFAVPESVTARMFLTLAESIERAKELNVQIDIEKQRIKKRTTDIKLAKTDTLPFVSFTSDYEHLTGVHTFLNTVDFSWDLSSIMLDQSNSRNFSLQAAEKRKVMIESRLVLRVKTRYFKFMQLKQELITLQKAQNLLLQQRLITEQLVAAQLKLDTALLRIDDRKHSIQNHILLKKSEVGQARSLLLQLLNLEDSIEVAFANCEIDFPQLTAQSQLTAQVMHSSPEIQSMILEKQAIVESIKDPWLNKLPTITASTGYQQEWPLANDGVDFHLVVSIPLSDMGRTQTKNEISRALVSIKRAEIKQKTKEHIDQITLLYQKAQQNKILFSALQVSGDHLRQTLKATENEYESGLMSVADLFQIQKDLIDTDFQMSKCFYDYMAIFAAIQYFQGADK